jgi:hypothetical protein
MAMQYLCKFQKNNYKTQMIFWYFERGNACALNIFMHEQYPFDSLNQNNLAHVGKAMYALPLQVWKDMLCNLMYFWDYL